MIPQFSQLFIYSPDKNSSVCKIFISSPTLDKEQSLGKLFGIIEIESNDRGLWETANHLAESLEKDYYGDDNVQIVMGTPTKAISVEKTFEKSIQNFNDRLIELIKGGKLASLLDKMNIIIGVLNGTKTYFTAVGNTNVLLTHQLKSQEYRIIDVLSNTGGKEEKINPFKILSHIISGEADKNDSLIFCTNTLLDYLSLDKIKQTLSTLEPVSAARHLKDLLLEASINTVFASIIIKLTPTEYEETAKEIRLPQKSINSLLATEKSTEQYLSPNFRFNINRYSSLILNKGKEAALSTLYSLKKYWQEKDKERKTANKKIKTKQQIAAQALPQEDEYKEPEIYITPAKEDIDITLEEAEIAEERLELEESYHPEAEVSNIEKRPALQQPELLVPKKKLAIPANPTPGQIFLAAAKRLAINLYSLIKRFTFWLLRNIKMLFYIISNKSGQRKQKIQELYSNLIGWIAFYVKKFRDLPRLSQGLLVVSAILFILFTQSIVSMVENKINGTSLEDFNNIVTQITQKKDEAQAALIYNDEDRANKLMAEINSLYTSLKPSGNNEKNKLNDLNTQLIELVKKLQHVKEVDPKMLTDFSILNKDGHEFKATTLTLLDQQLYTVNSDDNSLYSVNINNPKPTPTNITSNNPQVRLSTNYQNGVIYYHGGNSLVEFDAKGNVLEEIKIDLSGQENKITDFEQYNNRIYVLNPSANQIYRYNFLSDNNFGNVKNWLNAGADVQNAAAIAVDGDVYVLMNNGQIKKFKAGNQDSAFQDPSITPPMNQPTKITTGAKNLYILDPNGRRLVVLDKINGKIIAQYTSLKFTGLKEVTINEKTKKAYLLNENLVYQIDL